MTWVAMTRRFIYLATVVGRMEDTQDLGLDGTVTTEHGEFAVALNELDEENDRVRVRFLEGTPTAEKGDSRWVSADAVTE